MEVQEESAKKQKTEEEEKFFFGKASDNDTDESVQLQIRYGTKSQSEVLYFEKSSSSEVSSLEWMEFERKALKWLEFEKETVEGDFPNYGDVRLKGECLINEPNAVAAIVANNSSTLLPLLAKVKEGAKVGILDLGDYGEEKSERTRKVYLLEAFSLKEEEFNDYFTNYEIDAYGLTRIARLKKMCNYYKALVILEKVGEKKIRITLPGGKRRLGESTFQCATRELFEETGLRVEEYNFLLKETSVENESKCRFLPFFIRTD